MDNHHNGIHHITALAGDAQQNVDFYVKTLGMRLVKKSINQDQPGIYHLFYGNAEGDPGSGLTFFPWPRARQGSPGMGQAVKVALAVPEDSKDFWTDYLSEQQIDFDGPYDRFGQEAIGFQDPDGLPLELVFDKECGKLTGWKQSTVPAAHTIRGFRGTTLLLKEAGPTAEVLREVFGFQESERSDNARHYTTDAPIGGSVVIEEESDSPGGNGKGVIHHVAFRAEDKEQQQEMRQTVQEMGLRPTEVIDRHWFYSVYFHSPGGVLFEIATDGPGYAVDEDPDKLGQQLILPPWFESRRETIEQQLPELKT